MANVAQIKSGIMIYIDERVSEVQKLWLEYCYMYLCECKYLGSIIDDSVITYDEIINATDSVSTNVASTVSTNFYNKEVRYKKDRYILQTVLLVVILLMNFKKSVLKIVHVTLLWWDN